MPAEPKKRLRCAIYTRKSTEHGLELEFNSLDAQREACEAYIKSQAHEGWSALPARYDDAAFSGGNLDRPALQTLLSDIDAGRVDVVVVYKIDRLTRSLADFAKLVERFEKNGVSFVSVTQQFNTTTSMGRLTLNVLLSFAQFERELSSERVRDKVAASRQKGKWTGGGVPLGYDVKDKKLVVNATEAETVRLIFARYLHLKCLRRLKHDLDQCGVLSKRRQTASDHLGGVPLTYGPLAYLLKNRTYLGEVGYKGQWFAGEHMAIIDPSLFNAVQILLTHNAVSRHRQRSRHQSLLTGLLFDDRGNRMTPSFTSKRGVRYRFYVSSALLTARGSPAASVRRVAAPELEQTVIAALRERVPQAGGRSDQDLIASQVERVVVSAAKISICLKTDKARLVELTCPPTQTPGIRIETKACASSKEPDFSLVQALARAHAWRKALANGAYQSVEELAHAVAWNPKVVRKALRLAFLAPDLTEAIMAGMQPQALSLSKLQGISAYCWDEQRRCSVSPAVCQGALPCKSVESGS
jgi:DNA invertase Pin-like site-specific DNA recombinase